MIWALEEGPYSMTQDTVYFIQIFGQELLAKIGLSKVALATSSFYFSPVFPRKYEQIMC